MRLLLGLSVVVAIVGCESKPTTPKLTVVVNGPGTVKSTPAGIDCPPACALEYPAGTAVALKLSSDASGSFEVAGLPSSQGPQRVVTLENHVTVTVTTKAQPGGGGAVPGGAAPSSAPSSGGAGSSPPSGAAPSSAPAAPTGAAPSPAPASPAP
jgi:hypothetical protein